MPCLARSKIARVYIAPKDPNGLHDNANLDAADLDTVVPSLVGVLVIHLLLGLVVLLLLSTVLHLLLLLAGVAARHWVRSSMVRLAVLRMLRLVLLVVVVVRHLRRSVAAGLQLDVDAALVLFGVILQS